MKPTFLMLICGVLATGCTKGTDSRQDQNPLAAVELEQITEVRFMGTSSPIPGDHFESTDPALIEEVFTKAAALRRADETHITMPGSITMIRFYSDPDTMVAEISVGGDGKTVVVHGPVDARTTVVAASPDFCLYCFELLKTHSPQVLQQMLTSDDRGNRELHLKSYPFDQVPPKTETAE